MPGVLTAGTVWGTVPALCLSRPRHAAHHCGQLVGAGVSDQLQGAVSCSAARAKAPAVRPASLGGSASSGAVGGTQAS